MSKLQELEPILRLNKISKGFPGVQALDSISFEVYSGQIHALVGENGAGKSTLMKILAGVYQADEGTIHYHNQLVRFTNPEQSQKAGIAIIHQELNLIPGLTVGENIFLGREPTKSKIFIDWDKLYAKTQELLDVLKIDFSPRMLVGELSVGNRQMVEIAKALSLNAQILVMDEPTDALTDKETQSLFQVIDGLKQNGVGIIYISHRLQEIIQIADQVTVLRDGIKISTRQVDSILESDIIQDMVGRKIEDQYPYQAQMPGDPILRVEGLTNSFVSNITFEVRGGEVLGFSGLIGSGRTELAKTIIGRIPFSVGTMEIRGKEVHPNHPQESMNLGIFYLSEDRKEEGLILSMSVGHNMTLSSLELFTKPYGLSITEEQKKIAEYISRLQIRTPNQDKQIKFLSGGNQQKVGIAKGLLRQPQLLILDEPTRGVDVGAKREIYELIGELKAQGVGIMLISSDLPEVMGLSDRILIMAEGNISAEFERKDFSAHKIMAAAVAYGGKIDTTV